MIEMPITLEPYGSYCNRLIEETHKMVTEMHGIVHCEECKYGSRDPYDMRPIWCFYFDRYRNETDFCSRGERKKPTEF